MSQQVQSCRDYVTQSPPSQNLDKHIDESKSQVCKLINPKGGGEKVKYAYKKNVITLSVKMSPSFRMTSD